jgi:hypothetical protein
LIHYLRKLLKAPEKEGKWSQWLAGADDVEVAATYTDFDRRHVMEKANCVLNAVFIMQNKTAHGEVCSWEDSCKQAAEMSSKNVHWRTVQTWYLELHHNFDVDSDTHSMLDLRFKRSEKGKAE